MRKFLYFAVLFFLCTAFAKHPVYVSVTELQYKPQRQALEISVKIFSDDLAETLSKRKGERIEIGTDREHPRATEYIQEYLRERLRLRADGRALEFRYVGREVERQDFYALWVYLEVPQLSPFRTLTIQNSILHEAFASQNNVITLRNTNGTKRGSLVRGYDQMDFVVE